MAYQSKTWVDRQTEYPNRRKITHPDTTQEQVTVARDEGTVYAEGDAFSAQNMNNLESRINAGITAVARTDTYPSLETDQKTIVGAINEVAADKNIAEVYDFAQTYAVGDYVIEGTQLYKCIEPVTVAEAFDPEKWEAVLVTDEMATSGGAVIDDTTTSQDKTWSSYKIDAELGAKQDELTAGTGITISAQNVISATGGGASALDDLTDVDITTPSNGDVLKYNATAQKWENGTGGGGATYTAGENISISQQNVISARRQPHNLLFGGDDWTTFMGTPDDGLISFWPWDIELTFGTRGYIIEGVSEHTSTQRVMYATKPFIRSLYWSAVDYDLYLKIEIDGTRFIKKLYIEDKSIGLTNVSFSLGGVDFTISSVSMSVDTLPIQTYFRINDILYDDTNESHTCELCGVSLEEHEYCELPSDTRDALIISSLKYKQDTFNTKTGTLTAGSTSITLTHSKLYTSSTIEIFTDTWGVNPTNVVVASGSITLTFEAQQNDVGVKVRWT